MKRARWFLPLSFLWLASAAHAQEASDLAAPLAQDAPEYTLTVKPVALKVGKPGAVEVVITSKGTWHWNKDFPAKLELAAANTTIERPVLKQPDFTVTTTTVGATFTVTATQAGASQGTLTGKLGFCDDKVCVTKKVELPVSVVATH